LLLTAAPVVAHAETLETFNRARTEFVDRMVESHAFDHDALTDLLAGAQLDQRVLDAISRPAERVVPWHEYRKIFLTDSRIAAGVAFWRTHAASIEAVAGRYDVPAEILVAILGVETFFGQRMGTYRVLDSLATLAFAYPPRGSFFASELESFLLLSREEGTEVLDALGSYAGAMGAGQFIPSSFRAYAVDGNGDGRRDLWTDWQDVLGSVANYFKVHGWKAGEPVADRAARAPQGSAAEPSGGLDLDETVATLSRMGYVFATDLPDSAPAKAFAFEAEGDATEYWVGYHNFRVITRYNRSAKYALATYQLGQAIHAAYAGAGRAARSD
jgi:membrane-bound lytic murein transglycosylase B